MSGSRIWRLVPAILSALLHLCVVEPGEPSVKAADDESSSTSETIAIVYTTDGQRAAAATARFISVDHSPARQAGSSGLVDSTLSDNEGIVRFDALAYETYNIEYEQHGLAARRAAVTIDDAFLANGDTLRDTLRAPGSLHGVVRLQPYHDARKVLLVLFGTRQVVTPNDSSGTFTIPEIAAGGYDVRVMALYPDYGVIDTTFTIRSAHTDTLADTLVLPFEGVGPVEGLKMMYDTAWQVTNLSWEPHHAGRTAGYRVYRTGPAGQTHLLTTPPLRDTVYTDTLVLRDSLTHQATFRYRVLAVDSVDNEGPGAQTVTVEATAPYERLRTLGGHGSEPGTFASVGGMSVGPDSNVYVCDVSGSRIEAFDREGIFLFCFGDSGLFSAPYDIAFGLDGRAYVADYGGRRIHVITASGEHLTAFGVEGTDERHVQCPLSITADTESLYILEEGSERVAVWGTDGTVRRTLASGATGCVTPRAIRAGAGSSLLIADAGRHAVLAVDPVTGRSRVLTENLDQPVWVAYEASEELVYVAEHESGYIITTASDGEPRWRWRASMRRITSVVAVSPDVIWVGDEAQVSRFRRRK